ncbi:MAG TPA: molecular chaperone DnaJ, partial [Myxococcota bacterium]|nr:molecular chaperone DnaJ [Myxococcota bacterium]
MAEPQKRDYYEVLGVPRDAAAPELKAAFRDAARRWHPDASAANGLPPDPQAEERFKEANEAYEVLSDPVRRRMYDVLGHRAAGAPGWNEGAARTFAEGAAAAQEVLQDLFRELVGGGARRRREKAPGRDLRYTLEVSFEDAARGVQTEVRVPRPLTCTTCAGSGAAAGTAPHACPACGGKGEVRVKRGFFSVGKVCVRCDGAGTIVEKPCPDCRGRGVRVEEQPLPVSVPPGVEDGRTFLVRGAGEPGANGARAGDLSVTVKLTPHPFFRRAPDGVVEVDVPVGVEMAALGGEIGVPTLDGIVRMKIPAGTQSGRVFRLKGRGLPAGASGRAQPGDQHV